MRRMPFQKFLITAAAVLSFTQNILYADEEVLSMKTDNEEEAFTVRRIIEFWKDGDYEIVKKQIVDFLSANPKSSLKDHLQGILGDIYLNERNFEIALKTYAKIDHPEVLAKTFINKLQCLYELQNFSELSQQASRYLQTAKNIPQDRLEELYFLFAEAMFYRGRDQADSQEKNSLYLQAGSYYQKLLQSPYREISLFALAEIHRGLEEYSQAATIYHELSERYPDQREELLFHAATMQAKYDENLAIENFQRVIAIHGKHEEKAQYNLLALYFQSQQYDRFLDAAKSAKISQEQSDLFQYMTGKSWYMKENYTNAKELLQQYIQSQTASSEYLKNALLLQMTCANQLDDVTLFRECLENFQSRFPNDAELPKALFMHAVMCKSRQDLSLVQEELAKIMQKFPNFAEQESLLFEYALVVHEKKQWEDSYQRFKEFLNKYPSSTYKNIASKYYLSSCFHLQQNPNDQKTITYSKEDFARDLHRIIYKSSILNEDELKDYKLLYGKVLFQIGKYQDSLELFKKYAEDHPDGAGLSELHYYMALNHFQLGSSPHQFYSHMEKALTLDPSLQEDVAVQLQMYNAYVNQVNQLKDGPEKTTFMSKAAWHLYQAYQLPGTELKIENRLWLANYYLEQLKANASDLDRETVYQRGKELFSGVLLKEKNELLAMTKDTVYLEGEVLKFVELLNENQEFSQSLSLLQNLVEKQSLSPEYNWKFQDQVLLQLAKNYEVLGQKDKAGETYQFLLKTKYDAVKSEASLHYARLQYNFLSPQSKNLNNPEVMEILNLLKDLQVKKHADTEPLHLEAAIEYAKIRYDLSPNDERVEKYLFFLNRLKEDFETNSDPLSGAYHQALKSSSKKFQIFDGYLKYVDAEIMRMRAKIEAALNNTLEAEECNEKALSLLTEIQTGNAIPQLQERVKQSIELINQFNSYD